MRKIETRLAELRIDNDLKQKDIAEQFNIKRSTYSMWEIGKSDLSIEMSNKLANFYNVSLDYLLGISNVKHIKESKDINLDIMCKRLKEIRKEHKITQKILGEKVGFAQTTYTCYENGSRTPTTIKLLYIAIFYNISFDYLVGKSNIKEIKKKEKVSSF